MSIPTLLPQTAEKLLHGFVVSERGYWSVLKASGEGLRDYLQGQVTQDIQRLKPGQGIHACLLTPQGKAVTELYIIEGIADELILLTPAHLANETVSRLRRFALGYQLRIGVVDSFCVFGLQGSGASAALSGVGLAEPGNEWLACSQHATAEAFALLMPKQPTGYWVIGKRQWLEQYLPVTSDETQTEAMRIIRGLPRLGSEWDASLHPLNANLVEFDGVSFDKGCYVGQEVTSRMHWRGGIKKKLYRVMLPDTQALPESLPCPVLSSGRIGELRSLAIDQANQCFGIALLPISTVNEKTALSLESGAELTVLEPCHA